MTAVSPSGEVNGFSVWCNACNILVKFEHIFPKLWYIGLAESLVHGGNLASRNRSMYDICSLTWGKFIRKCYWTFSSSFQVDLGCYHPIHKHRCHQSVEKVFLKNPTLNFFVIPCVPKCIICSFLKREIYCGVHVCISHIIRKVLTYRNKLEA